MGGAKTENRNKQIIDTLVRVVQETRANCTNVIKDTVFEPGPDCGESEIRIIQMCKQRVNNILDVLSRNINDLVSQLKNDIETGLFSSTDTRFFYEVETNLKDLTEQTVQISGINILETSRIIACRIQWDQSIDQDIRLQMAKMLDIYTRLQSMMNNKQRGFNPVPFILGLAALGIVILLIVKQVRK